jgi:hypothetical protein
VKQLPTTTDKSGYGTLALVVCVLAIVLLVILILHFTSVHVR